MNQPSRTPPIALILPGLLVAATGVGAGDLFTASLAGSKLQLAILWAAFAGALLKWTLNEGIARWQLATGTTLLEGWSQRLGQWIEWVFLVYLLIWSFVVGGAMITACGVAGSSFIQFGEPATSKIIWGFLHSMAGLALIWWGGFKLFERLMAASVAVMFITVLLTAVLLPGRDFSGTALEGAVAPTWGDVFAGFVPGTIPEQGVGWFLGVLGGVGGTVTLLSYGYWIREAGRTGERGIRECRIDLAVAYVLTAFFGAAMMIIGSIAQLEGKGPETAGVLASALHSVLGPVGQWAFLIGFWGAVFSSLLGVWQGVPYLFADFLNIRRQYARQRRGQSTADGDIAGRDDDGSLMRSKAYRGYLVALALVPLPLLFRKVEQVQLVYAVLGAFFMPLLALTLLLMNNRSAWVGPHRSGWLINAILLVTLVFFGYVGVREIVAAWGSAG